MTDDLTEPTSSNAVVGRFLRLFVPVAVICVGGAIALFRSELSADLNKIKSSEMTSVQVGVSSIGRVVQRITRDVAYLASHDALLDKLSRPEIRADGHVVLDWLTFSKTKAIYDQIRLLDATGFERKRINFNNGRPISVPASRLQDKGKRYYFTDTMKLSRGEFFISPLDLNIEGGAIETPYKPVIRIGTPVFDRAGKKRGIALLNYLGDRMLDEFGRTMGIDSSRGWLLDRKGYWLKGPSNDLEWGFMRQLPAASVARKYPAAWKHIAGSDQGQFEDEQGLWTFATAFPLIEGQKSSTGTREAFAPSRTLTESRDYFWKAVLLLPIEAYRATMWQTGLNIFAATAVLLAGLFFGCWRLASAWTHQEKAEEEVRRVNQGLERTVKARTDELRTRNDELESLIYVVSHDLRGPLMDFEEFSGWFKKSIQNVQDRLDQATPSALEIESITAQLGRQIPAHLEAMLKSTGRMYPLVNGLLMLSRASRVKLDILRLDMNAMVEAVVNKMDKQLNEAGGRIEIDELPGCNGDASQLNQVFSNLLDNAVKYRHPGRALVIKITGHLENSHIIYEVIDNGQGFATEHCQHVWDLFYRRVLMGDTEGDGLDLTLVHRIIDRHNGDITLESEEGSGSRFVISLPVKDG